MTLSPEFGVGLRLFGLRAELCPDRQKVWHFLGPHMNELSHALVKRFGHEIPYLAATLERIEDPLVESISRCTGRLFTRSYDDAWLADLIERIHVEQANGFDIRSRSAINREILTGFSTILSKRYRFSVSRFATLMDLATRVLLHDTAMAANFYYTGKLREARRTSEEMKEALSSFDLATTDVRRAVAAGAESLRQTSFDLRNVSDVAGEEAERATAASVATSDHVKAAAGATANLCAAIENLQRESARSASESGAAAARMGQTHETIQSLSVAVDRIGSVVDVIADVASQTNLLALNATIEAARAGDMGRGFAVVASEVKTLAMQTSKATSQIADLITTVQSITRCAVTEIGGAGQQVEALAATSQRLAEAVHQQMAASENIAKSAGATAGNAVTMTAALTTVSQNMDRTKETAASIFGLSQDLAAQTNAFEAAVETLFVTTRKRDVSIAPLPNILKPHAKEAQAATQTAGAVTR